MKYLTEVHKVIKYLYPKEGSTVLVKTVKSLKTTRIDNECERRQLNTLNLLTCLTMNLSSIIHHTVYHVVNLTHEKRTVRTYFPLLGLSLGLNLYRYTVITISDTP